ncbi:MAG: nicotinate-nucleotide--dimethylbenzimidazole phosphoribosyltransferase [Planctomycetota bacterium]
MRWSMPAPCELSRAAAADRQLRLTKPPGSLGRLESLAVEIAAWQATDRPQVRPASVLIFAADHPIAQADVSPYPQSVTAAMVKNFIRGGAASVVMAQTLGVGVQVIDVGVVGPREVISRAALPNSSISFWRAAVADADEADIRWADAMTSDVFASAWQAGCDAVATVLPDTRCVILGEMGIANSTLAAAVTSGLCNFAPDQVTGPGTGAAGSCLARKIEAVGQVRARVSGSPPLEILRRAGGRELAAIAGAATAALARRMVVIVDGFIASAAIAPVLAVDPAARAGTIFSHVGSEPGHRALLEWLKVSPLLALGMALGEGTGGLAAFPLLDLACATHNSMLTFAEAGVPDRV